MANFTDQLNPYENSHAFLCEELLQPGSCRCDATRTNMFSGHIAQAVILNNPDIPLVFTGFENKIGSYTSANVKTLNEPATVYAIFKKNKLQTIVILYYPNLKYFDLHVAKPVKHLTESYGYLLDNKYVLSLNVGDTIEPNTLIQNWSCTDEYGNFMYGKNLRTLYTSIEGLTYDDGIIASETAANKKLVHTSVEELEIMINPNDVLINYYGTKDEYKAFPNPGELIKNNILAVRRRIHKDTLARDVSTYELEKPNFESDTVYYISGEVVDIEIFSNIDISDDNLSNTNYFVQNQIKDLIEKSIEMQKFMIDTLYPIISNEEGYTYSEELGFQYFRAMSTYGKPWTRDDIEFDGVIIKFIIAKKSPAIEGSKITNRFGGKGVISAIIPDHLMPYCEDDPNEKPDLIINCLGVNNRLNIAQLWESELNFISHELVKKLAKEDVDINFAISTISDFLRLVNTSQYEHFISLDYDILVEYVKELLDFGYIPLNQPPFYGVISLENLYNCYNQFNIKPYKLEGVEADMIMGNNYYLKLRHEPAGKFSARSAGSINMTGVPVKKSESVRSNTAPYSDTPIKIGEQETNNLLIVNQPEETQRMIRMYSTDKGAREEVIRTLLTHENPESFKRIEIPEQIDSRPVLGFKTLLEYIGIELKK